MRLTLLIHVLAGALGLLSGYVALSVAKGAALHRKSGMLFVYFMVVMSMTGLLVSAARGIAPAINIPTALLTFYLVITGMTSVGSRAGWSRQLDVVGPDRLPAALRIPVLRVAAVVVPIVAIIYWQWRLRPRHLARTAIRLTMNQAMEISK